jgi:hypothetical protein
VGGFGSRSSAAASIRHNICIVTGAPARTRTLSAAWSARSSSSGAARGGAGLAADAACARARLPAVPQRAGTPAWPPLKQRSTPAAAHWRRWSVSGAPDGRRASRGGKARAGSRGRVPALLSAWGAWLPCCCPSWLPPPQAWPAA